VVELAKAIVALNLLQASMRRLDLRQKLTKFSGLRIFIPVVKCLEPLGDWGTAGYAAASFKMIHGIVNSKIGIHLEKSSFEKIFSSCRRLVNNPFASFSGADLRGCPKSRATHGSALTKDKLP
jgi:hypothetical protein